ncbi:13137_t:CDS:2, partial [Acaulospora colombiana]
PSIFVHEKMEIYPDHIYGGVPVFKPTWAQFKDFRTFVSAVKSYGYESVGYYVVRNIESERDYTVKEWAELCESSEHATPFPKSKHYPNSSVSDYLPLRKKKKNAGKSNKKNPLIKRHQATSSSTSKTPPGKNNLN